MFVFSVLLYLRHFLLLRSNSNLDVDNTANVGQPVESVGKKVSGSVSGSHGTTSSGPLRQVTSTVSGSHGTTSSGPLRQVTSTVSGSHGTTLSGPLRQLQLTDCVTLPAAVQRQLYLGEIDVLL